MNVRIVIDSTADTTPAVREKCAVVPLSVLFGDEQFADGVTLTAEDFYKKIAEGKVHPTTSQPNPALFAQAYEEAIEAGQDVVVLTISSKISGTYQSACIAAMDYPGRVHVVDTRNVAIGAGILAQYALELAEKGMPAADIAAELTAQRERIRLVAVVDTLEYLKRGGRVSPTVAFAGELLSIKPIIAIENGEVAVIGKVRGSKQANAFLNKDILTRGVDRKLPILLGYSGLSRDMLDKYRADSTHLWTPDQNSTVIGAAIGVHAGPGAVAVAFFQET